jgi:hypothetical protein
MEWWYQLPYPMTISNGFLWMQCNHIWVMHLVLRAILVEMGCISQNSRSKTWGINNEEGWEFLLAEFSVKKNIQVS